MYPRILRSLLLYNRAFAAGSAIFIVVVIFAAASLLVPLFPASGQDLFWQLAAALRNTLLFGLGVALLSRAIALAVGLIAGYLGGRTDRIIMAVSDAFVALPAFPLLVLFVFLFRGHMTLPLLALAMTAFGWSADVRLIRSVSGRLRTREFTRQAVYAGVSGPGVLFQEHLPFLLPAVFASVMKAMIGAIGMEIALSALGLAGVRAPTLGLIILRATRQAALTAGFWWWLAAPLAAAVVLFIGLFLLAEAMAQYIDPQARLGRMEAP
jgi:peptide/nickel transport system permease protein